jgi:hypothetical protein
VFLKNYELQITYYTLWVTIDEFSIEKPQAMKKRNFNKPFSKIINP